MSILLEKILKLHLHPKSGTPYWLKKERELGFSICKRIQSVDDLVELGPFDLQLLHQRPIEDFIPKSVLKQNRFITGETGGATGIPKTTAYCEGEFQTAFVKPFLSASKWKNPINKNHWLWLGPSGPHIIGKAARQIALATTGFDGFSVDFDPRWYRALTQGSIARTRYFDHLLVQATQIVQQQNIHYLFSTPVMLAEMVNVMHDKHREAIEFIYLGGMPIINSILNKLGDAFPNAQFLSGYGNTLFGVSHELKPHRPSNELPVYFPPAERIIMHLVSMDVGKNDEERLRHRVAYGERGQVVMHRLDESCFLANVMERDCGIRVADTGNSGVDGIMDPQAIQSNKFVVEKGIY
jgi:hypothetical protein